MNIHQRLILTSEQVDFTLAELYHAQVYAPERMVAAVIAFERAVRAHERTIVELEGHGDELDAPQILPEDYPLPPTRQLNPTELAVLRGMLP